MISLSPTIALQSQSAMLSNHLPMNSASTALKLTDLNNNHKTDTMNPMYVHVTLVANILSDVNYNCSLIIPTRSALCYTIKVNARICMCVLFRNDDIGTCTTTYCYRISDERFSHGPDNGGNMQIFLVYT